MSLQYKTRLFFLAAMIGLNFSFLSAEGWTASQKTFLSEAGQLAALQKTYFQQRVQSDWKGMYALQHPEFQKKISFEEFQFFDGRVVYNYRDGASQHLSGGMTPPLAFIKKNPGRKDALGNPQPRFYRWYPNPFITIDSYALEKISISENGKYAMVAVKLKGKEKLNTAMVRDNIEFDIAKPHVDYWEKVAGQWRITVLANPASISGGSKIPYFIPNSNAAWEKVKFIEIGADKLAMKP